MRIASESRKTVQHRLLGSRHCAFDGDREDLLP
jgi:hypothetical protein